MAGGLSKQWKHEKWGGGWGLMVGVQTLMGGGGGGGLYKHEGRTPITVTTGGRAEVMQTFTWETGVGEGGMVVGYGSPS